MHVTRGKRISSQFVPPDPFLKCHLPIYVEIRIYSDRTVRRLSCDVLFISSEDRSLAAGGDYRESGIGLQIKKEWAEPERGCHSGRRKSASSDVELRPVAVRPPVRSRRVVPCTVELVRSGRKVHALL